MTVTLQSMLGKGFFPKELPPVFTTEGFAGYAVSPGFAVQVSGKKPFISRPAVHNLARPSGLRRPLHIPNPFSYYQLAELLVGNWSRIDQHIRKSRLSVSVPVEDADQKRALIPASEGTKLNPQRAKTRSAAKFLLRTDVARFYSSIYTHSIPWALDGKDVAKQQRAGGLGNDLDRVVRNMQDGQTLGIPIGPDASLILAEIIASVVDRRLSKLRYSGLRFMDDYELVFASRAAAEEALPKVEAALAEFELDINQLKTSIEELPIEIERRWNATVPSYEFADTSEVKDLDLIAYFDVLFRLKGEYPRDAVLSYGIRRLRGLQFNDWELFQTLTFQAAVAEPGALDPIMTHLFDRSITPDPKRIDKLIAALLERHGPLGHGSEVVWALWMAIWFDRPVKNSIARALDGSTDPAVALLAWYARQKGLISKSIAFAKWNDSAAKGDLHGPSWLLSYEAHVQGWLPKSKVAPNVGADANFGPMLAAGVSFLDKSVSAPTVTALLEPLPEDDDMLWLDWSTYGF